MVCSKCGKPQPFSSGSFCSYCGSLVVSHQDQPSIVADLPVPEGKKGIPWESEERPKAPLSAFYFTCIEAILRPRKFYELLTSEVSAPVTPSIWFGLITGSFGIVMSWLWFELFSRYGGDLADVTGLIGFNESSSSMLMYAPILIVVQLFFIALYAKVMMRFTKAKRVSVRQVVRVLCYAESTSMLLIIPFVGSIMSIVLWIYSMLTGLQYLFGVRKTKVAVMLLLPCVLLFGFVVILLVAALVLGLFTGVNALNGWGSIFNQ